MKVLGNLINKYLKLMPKVESLIRSSFLSDSMQESYILMYRERLQRLL